MANVHVVTESLACLPREAEINYAVRSVAHRVIGPEGALDLDALLQRLDAGDAGELTLVRPGAADFAAVFDELLSWGVEIVSIHPPTGLGGGAEAAEAAARAAGADAPITVLRTECAGPALGLVALAAANAGDTADRESVAALAASVASRVRQVLVSTAPAHLARRGHPVPDGAGFEAVLYAVAEGELRALGGASPAGDALRMAYERVGAGAGAGAGDGESGGLRLALASAGADAEVAALATVLGTRLFPDETWIGRCDPALALELGPRSYAVATWEGEAG